MRRSATGTATQIDRSPYVSITVATQYSVPVK